jgi:hypothetical protein
MNILQMLIREHSKAMCNKIVKYVGDSEERFGELIGIFLKGPYRVTQRAAWPLSCCVEQHPELIGPHLKGIIRNLDKPGLADAVKRNTLRLLQFVTVPPSLQADAVNRCFAFLHDRKQPIAVKIFSMTVIANISKSRPDLRKELAIAIEDQLPHGSAGFINRGTRILRELRS